MLPKIHRLVKKRDFDLVFQKGKSIKNGFLVLKVLKNNKGIIRFGFIVSKKVSNKATARNLIKRRLRSLAAASLHQYAAGADVVVIALPDIAKKKFLEIKNALLGLFKNAKL